MRSLPKKWVFILSSSCTLIDTVGPVYILFRWPPSSTTLYRMPLMWRQTSCQWRESCSTLSSPQRYSQCPGCVRQQRLPRLRPLGICPPWPFHLLTGQLLRTLEPDNQSFPNDTMTITNFKALHCFLQQNISNNVISFQYSIMENTRHVWLLSCKGDALKKINNLFHVKKSH